MGNLGLKFHKTAESRRVPQFMFDLREMIILSQICRSEVAGSIRATVRLFFCETQYSEPNLWHVVLNFIMHEANFKFIFSWGMCGDPIAISISSRTRVFMYIPVFHTNWNMQLHEYLCSTIVVCYIEQRKIFCVNPTINNLSLTIRNLFRLRHYIFQE